MLAMKDYSISPRMCKGKSFLKEAEKMLRKCLMVWMLVVIVSGTVLAQQAEVGSRRLVECPTAGLLPRGSFDLDMRMYSEGGILAGVEIGLTDRLLVGLSYGGTDIIGNKPVHWNPRVEVEAKYRLSDETKLYPAMAIGFSSQGFGRYDENRKRYATKSKGAYVVLSKNYSFFGRLGIHGGINYSLEKEDGDDDISGFIGIDKGLGSELSVLAEYDFATNDNGEGSLGSGKGYFNAGVRWIFASRLSLEVDIKDLRKNGKRNAEPSRELRIVYMEYF